MAKVRILTYHRIGIPRTGRWESGTVPPERFKRQLAALRLLGYRFWGMDDLAQWLRAPGALDGRPVVLTFDDGYADLHAHALSLLTEVGAAATVFLVAARERADWMRRAAQGPLDLLSWEEVREMSEAGMAFGSHGLTHVRLTECDDRRLRAEVADSRKLIEDRLGRRVRHFSYPYGKADRRVVDAVRAAGYETACTTERGAVPAGADPLRLPRLTVGKRMGMLRFLLRLTVRH